MKKYFRKLLSFAALLTFLPISAEALPHSKDMTKIGVILPLSGEFARDGRIMRAAIESELADKDVKLIFEDEACNVTKALSAYKKLTNLDEVSFFLGLACGSPQQALAPLFGKHKQVAVLTASPTEQLFSLSKGSVFSSQYSIEEESKFIAMQMNGRKLKKALIVYYDSDFSRTHEKVFREHFKGEIVGVYRFSAFDPEHVKTAALTIARKKPEVVYVPDVTPMMLGLMSEIKKIGLNDIQVWSIYAAQTVDVLAAEGGSAEGLIYSYPDIDNSDALGYFPMLGARILYQTITACNRNVACVKSKLPELFPFDEQGILRSNLVLKTIENSEFVLLKKRGVESP